MHNRLDDSHKVPTAIPPAMLATRELLISDTLGGESRAKPTIPKA